MSGPDTRNNWPSASAASSVRAIHNHELWLAGSHASYGQYSDPSDPSHSYPEPPYNQEIPGKPLRRFIGRATRPQKPPASEERRGRTMGPPRPPPHMRPPTTNSWTMNLPPPPLAARTWSPLRTQQPGPIIPPPAQPRNWSPARGPQHQLPHKPLPPSYSMPVGLNALSISGSASSESLPIPAPVQEFDFELPPPPMVSGIDRADIMPRSAPISPIASPSNSRTGSRSGSRSGSRVGSRLSATTRKIFSALKSGGSRSTSRATSRTTSAVQSRSQSRSRILSDDDSLDGEEEWPPYIAARGPSDTVRLALAPLVQPSAGPLIDIDPKSRRPRTLAKHSHLTPAQAAEVETLAGPKTAIYFTGETGYESDDTSAFTDEDGTYHHKVGDHIAYRYRVVRLLGKGSFGSVLHSRDHKTGRMVAVKVTTNRPELRAQARVEAEIIQMLKKRGSPDKHHFLRHVDHFMFRGHMCIVTETLGPNLYEVLKRNLHRGLPLDSVRYITRQLLEALEFFAQNGVIHCDLKPENVLVSDVEQCQVKIIDFGSGCYENRRVYTYIQSRFYRAPEILLGMPYGHAIDMWSLGCMVPEMLLGQPLFRGEDEADQVALVCETLGSPEDEVLKVCSRAGVFFDMLRQPLRPYSPNGTLRVPQSRSLARILEPWPIAIDFCESLLQWSPTARLNATDAIFHDFCLGI